MADPTPQNSNAVSLVDMHAPAGMRMLSTAFDVDQRSDTLMAAPQLPWQERVRARDGLAADLQRMGQDVEQMVNIPEAAVYNAVIKGQRLEFPPLKSIEPPCAEIARVRLC